MKEVYPGIFQITVKGFLADLRPEVNVFVLAGPDGLVFDAGFGTRGVGRYVISEIKKIENLYADRGLDFNLTRVTTSHSHGDHYPGICYLRKKLGLKIVVTEKIAYNISHRKKYHRNYERIHTAEWYSHHRPLIRLVKSGVERCGRFLFHKIFGFRFITDPDIILSDTAAISINGKEWHFVPAPGHAPDHIHLHNKEEGLMFVGDNVLRGITPWLGPPESDLKAYMATLESILATEGLKILFCGHGSPVKNPYERTRNLLNYRRNRINDVYTHIAEKGTRGITFKEIVNAIYRNESGFKKNLGSGWIAVTLKYLENDKKIIFDGVRFKI